MVMFGRESRYEDLLSAINDAISTPQEDLELEENIFAEFQHTEDVSNIQKNFENKDLKRYLPLTMSEQKYTNVQQIRFDQIN